MKYIEEISYGDCFLYKDTLYILTSDFDTKHQHRCVNLKTGDIRWLSKTLIVHPVEIYTLDNENNISPIKTHSNTSNK